MKKILILILFAMLVLVSCRTVTAEPEPVDIGPAVQLLFDARPDDSSFRIKDVNNFADAVENSATYLMAWELWENYAISLEDYLKILRDTNLD